MLQKMKTDTSKLYKCPIFIYFCIRSSTKKFGNLEKITKFLHRWYLLTYQRLYGLWPKYVLNQVKLVETERKRERETETENPDGFALI